jgi:hypothetical protein
MAWILLDRMGLANVKPIMQPEYEGDDEVITDPDVGDGIQGEI